jgi:hypothetical protein
MDDIFKIYTVSPKRKRQPGFWLKPHVIIKCGQNIFVAVVKMYLVKIDKYGYKSIDSTQRKDASCEIRISKNDMELRICAKNKLDVFCSNKFSCEKQ